MATITSAASGNWSATGTWVGGVVPTSADTAVAATGHVVAIDVDVTCVQVQQTGTGKFTLGNGRTLTANVIGNAGTVATGGTVDVTATTSATITGNISGPSGNTTDLTAVVISGSGTVAINGNLTCGAGTTGTNSAVACNVIGSTVTITGTVNGGTGNANNGRTLLCGAVRTFNVVGPVIGAAGTTGTNAIAVTAAATVNITGNVTGSGTASNSVVNITATSGVVNVTGTVTGGTNTDSYAISATGTGSTVSIVGAAVAGPSRSHAVYSTATSNGVIITGDMTDHQAGTTAVNTRLFRLGATNSGTTKYANNTGFPSGGVVSRVSPDLVTGMPAVGNVRYNTVYGANSELTGTLRVPAAGSVALGVLVDNTTGTAVLTPAAIWDTLTSTMTTAGSIGERLKNTATVATTGDQLAATFP